MKLTKKTTFIILITTTSLFAKNSDREFLPLEKAPHPTNLAKQTSPKNSPEITIEQRSYTKNPDDSTTYFVTGTSFNGKENALFTRTTTVRQIEVASYEITGETTTTVKGVHAPINITKNFKQSVYIDGDGQYSIKGTTSDGLSYSASITCLTSGSCTVSGSYADKTALKTNFTFTLPKMVDFAEFDPTQLL